MKTTNTQPHPTSLALILEQVMGTLPTREVPRLPTPTATSGAVQTGEHTGPSDSNSASLKALTDYALCIGIDWGDRKHDLFAIRALAFKWIRVMFAWWQTPKPPSVIPGKHFYEEASHVYLRTNSALLIDF